jgi:hypothetical protein
MFPDYIKLPRTTEGLQDDYLNRALITRFSTRADNRVVYIWLAPGGSSHSFSFSTLQDLNRAVSMIVTGQDLESVTTEDIT